MSSLAEKPSKNQSRAALSGDMALIDGPLRRDCGRHRAIPSGKVDEKRFNFIIQHDPFFARQVMKAPADRLRHMNHIHSAPIG